MAEAKPPEHREEEGKAILDDVRRRTRLPQPVTPELALSAVICSISQHVSAGEARRLWTALPGTLAPLLGRCLLHRGETAARFGRVELFRRVSEHLGAPLPEAEHITSSVISALRSHLPGSVVGHVAAQLPRELRDVWFGPEPPVVEAHPIFRQITRDVALPSDISAGTVVGAVMCLLTRAMDVRLAREVVTSLPNGVRGLLEPCLERAPEAERLDRDTFLARLAMALHTENPEPIVRTVLQVVQPYLPEEIVDRATTELPSELRELWARP